MAAPSSSNGLPARPLVEACCDSVATARAAEQFGAGRIELCGPGDGGTTPSLGVMARCREELTVPIHVMIRPHTRDFLYDEDDIDVMANDIIAAKSLAIDGVVLGPLQANGHIHSQQLAELVALARPMKVIFHRAFDRVPDQRMALDVLLLHGVDGILTSGGARTALEGAEALRRLQQQAGARLTVMAGGGVRSDTARDLVAVSRLREIHARGTDPSIIQDLVATLSHQPDTAHDA